MSTSTQTMTRRCCICPDGTGSTRQPQFDRFDVRVCDGCGLMYLVDAVDQQAFVDAALRGGGDGGNGVDNTGTEGTIEYWSFPQQYERYQDVFESFFVERLERIRRAVPGLASLLDIGCGYGFFMDHVRRQGIEVAGMDINEQCVEYARTTFGPAQPDYVRGGRQTKIQISSTAYTRSHAASRLGLQGTDPVSDTDTSEQRLDCMDVQCCDFTEYVTEDRYDAIVFCDVLEHVDDPAGFLGRCRELLQDGGAIYVQVPNVTGDTLPPGGSYNWPFHVWQFSPATLRLLLESCGWQVVDWWTGVMGVIGVYERGGPTEEDHRMWERARKDRCGNRLQMLAVPGGATALL